MRSLFASHPQLDSRAVGLLDGWRYCPRCGASADQRDGYSVCTECAYTVWAAAIPGVQGLAVDESGRVLLGRRAYDPGSGRWDIPGGFIEEGEEALDGLRREFLEETGLEIDPVDFLGVWIEHYAERFIFCATWVVRPVGGDEKAGDDLVELGWFLPSDLPQPSEFAFSTHPQILGSWVARQS